MMSNLKLPLPNDMALAHSQKLQQMICTQIEKQQWISFAEYQNLALYAPGLGYYSAGATKFGKDGDFTTAPEISILFGKTLARQAQEIFQSTSKNILEVGAGSGKLALDLLRELEKLNTLPDAYYILEAGADLRERQKKLLKTHLPHLFDRIHWLETLPQNFSGLVLGNEVLDAMPVHLIVWRDGEIFERGVACDGNKNFVWQDRQIEDANLLKVAMEINPGNNYVSEIGLAVRGFIRSLADNLKEGVVIMFDYGFDHKQYYHPQRNNGTMMCHYRHHAHADPFYMPGLQDITTHVDFSAVASTASENGLSIIGYSNQAQFLINNGITEILAQTSAEDVSAYLPLANQARWLLSPAEMGEFFKVIALAKNFPVPLNGFVEGNKSHVL